MHCFTRVVHREIFFGDIQTVLLKLFSCDQTCLFILVYSKETVKILISALIILGGAWSMKKITKLIKWMLNSFRSISNLKVSDNSENENNSRKSKSSLIKKMSPEKNLPRDPKQAEILKISLILFKDLCCCILQFVCMSIVATSSLLSNDFKLY